MSWFWVTFYVAVDLCLTRAICRSYRKRLEVRGETIEIQRKHIESLEAHITRQTIVLDLSQTSMN